MGRIFKPRYNVRDPKTREWVSKVSKHFHIEWTDASGRTRHRKAGLTESAAKDALVKAEADTLAERNGLPTRRIGDITWAEIQEKYMASQKAHITNAHLKILRQRLDRFFVGSRVVLVKHLTPDVANAYLNQLQDQGLSPRTINWYLQAIKGMLSWAMRNRILPYSPLDCIRPRPITEVRLKRRAMTEDEITRLLTAALQGPLRRATKVYQNRPRKDGTYKPADIPAIKIARLAEEGRLIVLTYRLMLETGLRRNEVQSLTWADVDLENGTLTTRPTWVGNKNGKEETLPLAPGLLATLREWRGKHSGHATMKIAKVTSRLLRDFDDDLVAAGIASRVPVDSKDKPIPLDREGKPTAKPVRWIVSKKDSAGRTLDLHCLRHTFGTRLVGAGVDIKTAQSLMRHSCPTMTLGIYVHADTQRMKEGVSSFPQQWKLADDATNNAELSCKNDVLIVKDNADKSTQEQQKAASFIGQPTRGQQGCATVTHKYFIRKALHKFTRSLPKPEVARSNRAGDTKSVHRYARAHTRRCP